MSSEKRNVVHILPDNVASRIAAGEVVQRPSSVVKELVENSIDAGADHIHIILKDSGRTLIQVIDNGVGMSAEDAVLSFQRHATSKIKVADDLFNLSTMGFRGEALYSIAAVAEVELKTRREEDELGSRVIFSGGELESQEYTGCEKGCNISVRHLFFNIPARRKFLKSNETELRNVINCFEQIATYYNNISFSLSNNGNEIYRLEPESRLHRILSLFGKKIGNQMLPIEADTTLVRISGYTGNIDAAQKRGSCQYFFVNGRYIQHPYFNRAVSSAYEKILPDDMRPAYFIFFDVDPSKIDVNIHPSKTEVKFENEQAIFPIITACIREALNKANIMPGIDFEGADSNLIPQFKNGQIFAKEPTISVDPCFDPFKSFDIPSYGHDRPASYGWEKLFGKNEANESPASSYITRDETEDCNFVISGKYLVSKNGNYLQITNLYRARFQVLFEKYSNAMEDETVTGTSILFPELLELSAKEDLAFAQMRNSLEKIGFKFEDFGKHAYQICSVPVSTENTNYASIIKDLINDNDFVSIAEKQGYKLAEKMAREAAAACDAYNTETAKKLIAELRKCKSPAFTHYGKAIWLNIDDNEISRLFSR